MTKKLPGFPEHEPAKPISVTQKPEGVKKPFEDGSSKTTPPYDPSQWTEPPVVYYPDPDEEVRVEPFNNQGCLEESLYAFFYLGYVLAKKTYELLQTPIYEKQPDFKATSAKQKRPSAKERRRNQITGFDLVFFFSSIWFLWTSFDRFTDKLSYYQQFDPNVLQQLLAYWRDLLVTIQNVESINKMSVALHYREVLGAALGSIVLSTELLKIYKALPDSPVKNPPKALAAPSSQKLTTTRKTKAKSTVSGQRTDGTAAKKPK